MVDHLRGSVALGAGIALFMALAGCGGSAPSEQSQSPSAGSSEESPPAFDAEQYFAGKNVRVIVNHSAGGGSDILARFVMKDFGTKIPGNPRVAVTNEEGLGGINDVYEAPDDEVVIGLTSRASNLFTTVLDPASTIDPTKIRIIGGLGDTPRGLVVLGDYAKAHKTLESATGSQEQLKFAGSVGSPSDLTTSPLLVSWLCDSFKLNCDMLKVAEDSSSDLDLMMERGEINIDDTNMTTVVRNHADKIRAGDASVYFQYGGGEFFVVNTPDGITAPQAKDVIPAELYPGFEQILPLTTGGGVGNTFYVGPSVPDGAVDVLRKAFIDVSEPQAGTIGGLMAGTGPGPTDLVQIKPMSGDEAQKAYDSATETFNTSRPEYEKLQQKYWDQFWK